MKKSYTLAAIAILCWSTVATIVKLLLGSLGSMQVLSCSSLFACLSLLIINIATGNIPSIEPIQLLGFAWNGIFTMAIANTAWMIALESGKTAKISNLAYITPFLSLIWTAIILKEKIGIFSILGLVVIVLGIIIQLKDKKEK